MKQIISFEKEITFKTMIGEITSISLEHTLAFQTSSTISGDMIVSGTYKMTEASTLEDDFQYAIPVDIMLTKELEEDNRSITIHNFTYDIRNEDTLHLYIDVLVKGREIIELEEELREEPKIDENITSEVQEESKEILDKLLTIISPMDNPILIEGHTDNRAIKTSKFPSNWELSADRAVNVVRYFVEVRGQDPKRFSAIGYGEFQPVAPNDSYEGMAKNRRVDILIVTADKEEN